MMAIRISLREGELDSSNSFNFQNTNNFKGPFPCVLYFCLRLRMTVTAAVLTPKLATTLLSHRLLAWTF